MFAPIAIAMQHGLIMQQNIIFQTFLLVGSAEIFDKTFFIAMVLAMQHRGHSMTVFTGCFAALVAHVLMAAACGYAISSFMSPRTLDMAAAVLYGVFACLYARDYINADPEDQCEFEETKAEFAQEDIMTSDSAAAFEKRHYGTEALAAPIKKTKAEMLSSAALKVALTAFTTTFIGEFGDRTQIAMIGQHASQPIIPVCIGSTVAFFVLCMIAVMSGLYLSDCAVTQRQVCLIGGISFAVFSVISLYDGLHTKTYRDPVAGMFVQLSR